ncbi:hypothetical protein SIN8267_02545 [Sinobacterium norvegicum]|uniref:STAS/SEC14 domain-containing protein n=1 Tax=Sinobacterium norvegicum TaxID=1641715 RepID=A0ABN8EL14_9GAMM|nr:STAS/SEC14 domain-containing protein [Sinobacterium norvegicum]CAH0992425.1 hypothetical protein SIN8267_02545 [Sinobacterium norvegicum]
MFNVMKNGSNRLDLELRGKIDSDGMRLALEQMFSAAESIESGRMLYRIHDFDLPTLGAIGVELSRLPELLRMVKKFDRCAVLCDKQWVQKIGEFEGRLIPGLDIKSFNSDETDAAEAWLAE